MAQQLRSFAALAEGPSFVPYYIGQLVNAFNSSSRDKAPPAGHPRHCMCMVHIHRHKHTHSYKNKSLNKTNK